MSSDSYDPIARYYDLTHADLADDLPLLIDLARQANGPLLELGCGSGRLLPLVVHVPRWVGIDQSAEMLRRAQDRVATLPADQQARVTLVEGEMSQLALPDPDIRFGLAVLPYNTVMHLTTPDLTRLLKKLRPFLAKNGRLFIDVINPFAVADTPDDPTLLLERTFVDTEQGQQVLQFAANRLDDDQQQLHITWVYDATPLNGGPVHRTISQMSYHYRFPHQLTMLLESCGYRLEAMWGDYDRAPFDEESDRLLLLAS